MTMKMRFGVGMSLVAALAMIASQAAAQDWPQWRGPNRDGSVTGFNVPAAWPTSLNEQWKVDVGFGYASPILIGDVVYMFTRQGDDEVMTALDAGSGETRWSTSYPASFNMVAATRNHGPGLSARDARRTQGA